MSICALRLKLVPSSGEAGSTTSGRIVVASDAGIPRKEPDRILYRPRSSITFHLYVCRYCCETLDGNVE